MAEPTPKAPTNKKADDDAIYDFVANSETGVIALEVTDAFDLGKTTVREKLASIYRDIYKEDHDPYRNREEWDWPGTNDVQTGETSDSTGCSSESDPDSETDLAPAVRRLDQSQRMSEDHDDE